MPVRFICGHETHVLYWVKGHSTIFDELVHVLLVPHRETNDGKRWKASGNINHLTILPSSPYIVEL
jgi:hypothetical protein